MSTLNEICNVVAGILEVDAKLINENCNANNTDNWDSLAHLQIIMAIETKFNIRFKTLEINELKSIQKLNSRVEELLKVL